MLSGLKNCFSSSSKSSNVDKELKTPLLPVMEHFSELKEQPSIPSQSDDADANNFLTCPFVVSQDLRKDARVKKELKAKRRVEVYSPNARKQTRRNRRGFSRQDPSELLAKTHLLQLLSNQDQEARVRQACKMNAADLAKMSSIDRQDLILTAELFLVKYEKHVFAKQICRLLARLHRYEGDWQKALQYQALAQVKAKELEGVLPELQEGITYLEIVSDCLEEQHKQKGLCKEVGDAGIKTAKRLQHYLQICGGIPFAYRGTLNLWWGRIESLHPEADLCMAEMHFKLARQWFTVGQSKRGLDLALQHLIQLKHMTGCAQEASAYEKELAGLTCGSDK